MDAIEHDILRVHLEHVRARRRRDALIREAARRGKTKYRIWKVLRDGAGDDAPSQTAVRLIAKARNRGGTGSEPAPPQPGD